MDMALIRFDPTLDFDTPAPLVVQQAIAVAEDTTWFDTFPATSTISQQVVRSYMVTPGQTDALKAMELQMAISLANAFTPEEIMTIYAQRIYLGARCFGFADALEHRINVSMDDATLADALTLAAIIKAPVLFGDDPTRLEARFNRLAVDGATAGVWSNTVSKGLIEAGPTPFRADAACPPR